MNVAFTILVVLIVLAAILLIVVVLLQNDQDGECDVHIFYFISICR